MIELLASSPLVHAIGVTLVAFLWQGTAIGVMAFAALTTLRRAAAHARYLTACAALAAMAIMPMATLSRELRAASPRSEVSHAPAPAATAAPSRAGNDDGLQIHTTAEPDNRGEAALPFIVAGWSVGVFALTVHVLFGWIQIGRLRRHARAIEDVSWTSRLARLASRLNIARPVRLLESSRVHVPAVIGWLRPAILLPASALSGLTTTQLDAIVAHELAHIRRADFLVNLVQRAVEVALFYHPAVWWISREIRREREHCCDDIAAGCCDSRRDYAAALGALAQLSARTPALVVGARSGDIVGRIRRLVDPRVDPARWTGGDVMIVIPAALCLIASVSASTSQIVAPAVPVVAAPASPPAPASVPVLAAAPTAVATPGLAPAPLSVPIVAAKAATPLVSAPVQAAPARIAPQPVASVSPAPVVEDVRPEQATGRVYGEVRDQFGGVLPGVTVTTHTAGGSPDRSTHTNARGQFSIDNLPAGTYTVQAGSMPGFKTVSVSVRVIADDVAVPIQLQVGDLTQHVSVIASKTAAPSRPILVVRPLACETSADCLRAAGDAYAAGDLRTTDALISQALDRRRAEQPGLFQVTPRRQTFVITNSDVVRVGGDIKAPSKTHDVVPLYPPEALAAGIDGVVVIDATIAKDGSIWEAHIVNGKRELNLSALDAVRLWKFTPTLLDGVPVNVSATITIDFSLR